MSFIWFKVKTNLFHFIHWELFWRTDYISVIHKSRSLGNNRIYIYFFCVNNAYLFIFQLLSLLKFAIDCYNTNWIWLSWSSWIVKQIVSSNSSMTRNNLINFYRKRCVFLISWFYCRVIKSFGVIYHLCLLLYWPKHLIKYALFGWNIWNRYPFSLQIDIFFHKDLVNC